MFQSFFFTSAALIFLAPSTNQGTSELPVGISILASQTNCLWHAGATYFKIPFSWSCKQKRSLVDLLSNYVEQQFHEDQTDRKVFPWLRLKLSTCVGQRILKYEEEQTLERRCDEQRKRMTRADDSQMEDRAAGARSAIQKSRRTLEMGG